MLDDAFLICTVVAAIGSVVLIAIASARPRTVPRRIEWDDPAEAES